MPKTVCKWSKMLKNILLMTAAAGFQLAPTRLRAVRVLRAADYADAIEQDRVTLRRAAATKNEESDAVVDALLGLEQSCKERSRAEGASARGLASCKTLASEKTRVSPQAPHPQS